MNPMRFEFATTGRILFGSGTAKEIPDIARSLGRRALLVTHRSFTHLDPAVTHPLRGSAIATFEISGEPDFDRVRSGTEIGRAARCDHVVAIGGGSTIDAAKAIAMLLANGSDPLDHAEVIGAGRPITRPSLPWIAAPTTAGAGAEATRNAVLRSTEHRVKVSLRSPFMLPTVAVVDPDLTRDLPPSVTSTTGLDALSQVLEPFVSRKATPLTDALCREGLSLIGRSLLRSVARSMRPMEPSAQPSSPLSWRPTSLTRTIAYAQDTPRSLDSSPDAMKRVLKTVSPGSVP